MAQRIREQGCRMRRPMYPICVPAEQPFRSINGMSSGACRAYTLGSHVSASANTGDSAAHYALAFQIRNGVKGTEHWRSTGAETCSAVNVSALVGSQSQTTTSCLECERRAVRTTVDGWLWKRLAAGLAD